jgi:hypothetical protein
MPPTTPHPLHPSPRTPRRLTIGRSHPSEDVKVGARPDIYPASVLLVVAPPATDLADPSRIPRRSALRFPRRPENRRPTRTVVAAHGRCQAMLR